MPGRRRNCLATYRVLIPVWCNWNSRICFDRRHRKVCFNSCMVQLKCRTLHRLLHLERGFNSCMVQLKYPLKNGLSRSYTVLIPVWCNWNTVKACDNATVEAVLIPVWCNWNTCWGSCRITLSTVLIPVWCNWNSEIELQISEPHYRFNSCMVQLKFTRSRIKKSGTDSFNSCMVQLK